jgi:hypothetical protein
MGDANSISPEIGRYPAYREHRAVKLPEDLDAPMREKAAEFAHSRGIR